MRPGKPSFMAEAVAWFRAAHQLIDDAPRVLDDPLALDVLGPDAAKHIADQHDRLTQPYMKKARTLVLVRSRFAEEQLLEAHQARGVDQYVLLGAGLDTSPYRLPASLSSLQIFEVDHPDTQRWKRERLAAAGIEAPESLTYVGTDLNAVPLLDALIARGFDVDRPALFSWLGVCCYLELSAVNELFSAVGRLPAGTQLIFDFLLADAALSRTERENMATASKVGRNAGEPWITAFAPEVLRRQLQTAGFGHVFYLDVATATRRYLAMRADGLVMDPGMQVMSAIV